MTTPSANNSVFRGFFEKQKLTGPNFIDWYRQLRIVLSIKDKLNYLEQPIPPALVVPADIQQNLETLHAHEMLLELKTLFAQQAEQELLQTTRDFHSCKQEEGQSLGKTINELHAMLKLHEQTLPKNKAPALHSIRAGKVQKVNKHKKSQPQMAARGQNHGKGKNKLAYAPKPKIPPPPKREDPTKDSICHECASGAGGSGIFVIELNTILNRSWIYDTGCGTHICNTTQGLRMARKPYTHQVERAKDLLGLIHTDVCGPFKIMSRQGASYFVTLTDDYSRYGYVYLLKHKHEVFETFKVFQKEVENQLGKTIKSLLSDRGGAYMSQEFLDHLKDHEIIAHRTPPYTLQHNGYPKETMGYSFYYPPENKVLVARNAKFLENNLITQEASGSLENLEIIQEEDMHPFIDTSLNHEEDDLEIDEPQSDIVPIHRSTRTRHAPDRICLYIDAEEHELGDLGEPAYYKAALLDPESEKWLNAMNVEIQSMKDNDVWVLVELPPNGKTVGSKWLFKKKTDVDGVVHTYKAHIRAIRILIAIAAYYDYEIWQMDVKTAFLNGYLNEEVYMEQPEGFVNPKYPNWVCNLKHSIYGLKQASRSNITFLILYVDDILIMGNNIPMLQGVKSYLERCFAMKDLGEAAYILGIKIYRDRSRRLNGLCQSAYIEKILKRYCMENSKRGSIHMQEKLKLSKLQGASAPAELKRMQNVSYASAMGSIMYAVRCTRPDIAFAQNSSGFLATLMLDIRRMLMTSSLRLDMSEYIAAFDASKEAVWVRKFIFGLGVVPTIEEPISMYCDNTGAIAIANESGITKGARHFRAKVHYLREVIEYGDVKLEKFHTYDNLADPFTKALAFPNIQNILGILECFQLVVSCKSMFIIYLDNWDCKIILFSDE
nr:retrotransposon protein, putative, Ty1-copia subclass [Tanacetum cinerariifolium]